jgi:N-acetylglucosamine kinase-like BadF-type ATPase
MTTGYWIGIDGGGTKTLGVLLDERQNVRAEVREDSTNFNSVGDQLARLHLRQIILGLLDKGGLSAAEIAGIGLGISGVSRPEDREMIGTWVAEVLPEIPCLVENDALMALAAANDGDLFGVVVVCGTGMIVIGVDRAGERGRAGGWGALLDERGSGFAMGSAPLIERLTKLLHSEVHCAHIDTRQLSPAVGAARLAQRQMK